MSKETKQIPAFTVLPLVENPSAIRVLAISPKILDQMDWLDGTGHFKITPNWDDLEVVGRTPAGSVIVRQKSNGHLGRIHNLAFLEYIISKQEKRDVDAANVELLKLPQLFAV